MRTIVAVNPFRCRMWDLHDRLEGHISTETCRSEIDSFARHGQLVPVLGRPLTREPDYDVELVCGARRLFVARHLNKPLLVEVREMSDREAILAIDIENRQRADVSPYERGLSYAQWLRAGHFRCQEDIARGLKVSASQVSRLLKIAHLPSVIVNAFENPICICEGWGLSLIDALEDPERRQPTIRAARSIAATSPRPSPREVFRQLMSAGAKGRKVRSRARDEVVKDREGRQLFRVRRHSRDLALIIPVERVSATVFEGIRLALSDILRHATPQLRDNTRICGPQRDPLPHGTEAGPYGSS
jgi:ParB family chromosome partitioning protein